MALRGRHGEVPSREDEQRCEERAEQQAPAPQGPVHPPPPPVDYGVFMQGLVQAMQTQAHTQAALQAQLEAQERADVWWASLLRTRFEDGAVDVAWDEIRPHDQGLSETSAGSPAWSASPSSGSSSSASYRKTRKASSPSSSARVDQGEGFPDPSLLWRSTKNPEEWCFRDFLGLPKESFNDTFDPFGDRNLTSSPLAAKISSQRPAILPSISLNGQTLPLSSSVQNNKLCEGRPGGIQGVVPFNYEGRPGGVSRVLRFPSGVKEDQLSWVL
ncbi:hypothetical protein Taro_054007 [Colocasia esculenta]|uniref:Uncharacterized protein n=1 Tax=Colocasia esculenta TaxID=4460 RepID=A0A843XPW6_COLES|nr:hypothetical protein [Colocasia esculenta]